MTHDKPRLPGNFACAPGMRIEAHERVSELQFRQMAAQLSRLEQVIERLERRLWLAVYGVAGVILAQAVQSIMAVAP
ncbi:hypothetical protein JQU17_20375 [Ponticoccus sp. SC2-23]|uniref:GTA head formation protein, RCAP_rcc01685 family n=1 Tax=Alexandriicola marinus TaxID=2081710 RepID=UPI000FDB93EE|nr:hypothetical protein [Alexandriicola marinus]MBM1222573.1 hypothetical protein [Ponticoccus sp. SC6-9]MBM1227078.1 hypothetical protein [Ponticoccus sp. SC6-15]MBM1231499.1 hypothetical protein [Ponticoccus sp. SC6-38]MBM1236065.1 hypothetical protein [Ponticoccus sp. SC6-45]MBM1240522.1 hypothetical protein [Ponticoccus sp. SC6-49]MBM1245057.1 hypothetical protein [Ponticoccus sp. SC2-64]MBM1249539.1 hypothetical protein [Ponticoccus sp. SC6-42]MBM1254015.1 hypothetical protein [Pontico